MSHIYHAYYKILRQSIGRLLRRRGVVRTQGMVKREYDTCWSQTGGDVYKEAHRVRLGRSGTGIIWRRNIDFKKDSVEQFSKHIGMFGARHVLEVGCGNGLLLIALAALHPEVKEWTGVDLSSEGVQAAREFVMKPPLKAVRLLTGLMDDVIIERVRSAKISFLEGDMLTLPFRKEKFDFVYSNLAFEQIPQEYGTAFREARRVTQGHACFIEGFAEAQRSIFQRLHQKNVDYFRASFFDVLKASGYTLVKFESMPFAKVEFCTALLVCQAS